LPTDPLERPIPKVVPITAVNPGAYRGNEIKAIPPPDPLIDGVLDLDSTALLFGASGVGKSFVALDWALSVASGLAWQGHRAVKGPVLYFVGEGVVGLAPRYSAWQETTRIAEVDGILFVDHAPPLLRPEGKVEFRKWCEDEQPALVILDTIARHIPGADENSFEAMSQVVEIMDMARRLSGACVLGVHHTGKDDSLGARGHSSLKGAMDTEIWCKRTKPRSFKLLPTKQKNHEDGKSLGTFDLIPLVDSLVLKRDNAKGNPNEDRVIVVLAEMERASYGELRAGAIEAGVPAGSYDRVLARMISQSMVLTDGTDGEKVYFLPSDRW
jgi:hypothetical protein